MEETEKIKQNLGKSLRGIFAYKPAVIPKQPTTTPSKAELQKKYKINI